MSRLSCEHVDAYKKERGITTYSLIHTYFIACENQESRLKKFRECFCYKCKTRFQRIHACLFCVYFGCYDKNHIHEHAANLGHNLAVDTSYGNVYCFPCKDYMYDHELEIFSRNQKQQRGQVIAQWFPFDTVKLLKEDSEESEGSFRNKYLGLRGLVNLGQTCYMNCIVQVLTHNPLLRNYFLAEKHNTKTCHFNCDRSTCLACEMSFLFQEFYSGQEKPHIPCQLVYLMWKHAKHLDGYYPQDAHEFFIKLLDVLHEHMKSKGTKESDHSCECFIHQIFTGSLQSDVMCLSCRNKRTKVESFWDISLDLGAANASGNCVEEVSLNDCLERYTQPEQLYIKCDFCQSVCLSTKQLTVQKLPLVISFHLKRLEFGKKITTLVSFPELLNMTPFISSIRGRASEANGENHYCGSTTNGDNNFCLFAVVNHSGDKAGGHYISFIKMQHIWYKCDDEIITVASENDVLVSEGYLLFYHKERIDYKDRIMTVKKEEN